ncbi:hypothetical protein [Pseudomonas sp.]|uniref:hypothetical protein n=1 Tax=Pseudomonas sp. TaxID=306 RepID=UPI0039825C6A
MTSNTSSVILGLSIITASAIYAAPSLINEFTNQNVIGTTNGGVRLGQIYNESLKVKVEIKNTESGDVVLAVDENADRAYDAAVAEFEKLIQAKNENARSEDEKITPSTATLKLHMTMTLTSYVNYRSEHQPFYVLTLGEQETTVGVGANFSRTLIQVKEYSDKMGKEFLEKNQLLKI